MSSQKTNDDDAVDHQWADLKAKLVVSFVYQALRSGYSYY